MLPVSDAGLLEWRPSTWRHDFPPWSNRILLEILSGKHFCTAQPAVSETTSCRSKWSAHVMRTGK